MLELLPTLAISAKVKTPCVGYIRSLTKRYQVDKELICRGSIPYPSPVAETRPSLS